MSTVLRVGPYRFSFYAGNRGEPAHIHVERDVKVAKFWLSPIRLQCSGRFNRAEIRRIRALVQTHRALLLESWDDYFGRIKLMRRVPKRFQLLTIRWVSICPMAEQFPFRSNGSLVLFMPRRMKWRLIGDGQGIHWEDIDEDINLEGLLAGKSPGESQASFRKWL